MDYIKIRFGPAPPGSSDRLSRALEGLVRGYQGFRPQMDVYETPAEVMVICELPGVDKEDLVLEVDNRSLRIAGHRMEPPRAPGARFLLAELSYGAFERKVPLPAAVDPEAVEASMGNGFLEVRLKKRQAPGPLRVEVSGD